MILNKTIFLNNKIVNNFNITGEDADLELINLLLDKLKNRYKIKIYTDHIKNTIEADLKFDSEGPEDKINKYIYKYFFEDVNKKINLY